MMMRERRKVTNVARPARNPAGEGTDRGRHYSRLVPSVRAVIVSYADPSATARAVASLRAQTLRPSEIVVVDNHPAGSLGDLSATILRPGRNLGYPGGANLGAAGATTEWLLFLNPDAVAAPDAIETLLAVTGDDVGSVGAQIVLPDGRVNAGDNPLHLTGVSWAGRYGEPQESGPVREAAVVSGAAILVRTAAWRAVDGMEAEFFLYQDDVDLALRLRLAGWRVVFQPRALVEHEYEFDKGREKWFYLERNRAWTVLGVYRARTLLLLTPLLLATECTVLARAVGEGWWREKLRASWAVVRSARWIARRRRRVQATRAVPDTALLSLTTARFETPLAASRIASTSGPALESYRRFVLRWAGPR